MTTITAYLRTRLRCIILSARIALAFRRDPLLRALGIDITIKPHRVDIPGQHGTGIRAYWTSPGGHCDQSRLIRRTFEAQFHAASANVQMLSTEVPDPEQWRSNCDAIIDEIVTLTHARVLAFLRTDLKTPKRTDDIRTRNRMLRAAHRQGHIVLGEAWDLANVPSCVDAVEVDLKGVWDVDPGQFELVFTRPEVKLTDDGVFTTVRVDADVAMAYRGSKEEYPVRWKRDERKPQPAATEDAGANA